MNIQIHREGKTTMLQLDHGVQIYAGLIQDKAGLLHIVIGDAGSRQEFIFGCQGNGFEVHKTVNVINMLEEALRAS